MCQSPKLFEQVSTLRFSYNLLLNGSEYKLYLGHCDEVTSCYLVLPSCCWLRFNKKWQDHDQRPLQLVTSGKTEQIKARILPNALWYKWLTILLKSLDNVFRGALIEQNRNKEERGRQWPIKTFFEFPTFKVKQLSDKVKSKCAIASCLCL